MIKIPIHIKPEIICKEENKEQAELMGALLEYYFASSKGKNDIQKFFETTATRLSNEGFVISKGTC